MSDGLELREGTINGGSMSDSVTFIKCDRAVVNAFDLISDAQPFSRSWYGEPDAISYAKFETDHMMF